MSSGMLPREEWRKWRAMHPLEVRLLPHPTGLSLELLARAVEKATEALYDELGASLAADLDTLERVSAIDRVRRRLRQFLRFSVALSVAALALETEQQP